MKKITIKIMTAILAVITALSFTACTSGASAYDIAVKNGFKGTEAEWLASLNGANGKDGKDSDITIETLYAAAKADEQAKEAEKTAYRKARECVAEAEREGDAKVAAQGARFYEQSAKMREAAEARVESAADFILKELFAL